jgi:phage N-6-adenine-methyltransferase
MTDFAGSNTPADQRDLWRTPPAIFTALDAEFCFQLDAAAAPHNALCRKFITAEQNTLETPWADYLNVPGYVWMNPPYSDITPFVKKAAAESANQIGTVMLVPADTSVGWFREAIQTASEVRFITAGRLAFINPLTGKPVSGNNKGSLLIIWKPSPRRISLLPISASWRRITSKRGCRTTATCPPRVSCQRRPALPRRQSTAC